MSNDLISREAVLGLCGALIGNTLREQIANLPAIKPQVVANISGGLLQGASADYPVDVYALDFDTEGCEPSELIEVEGSEARLGQESALVDPDFVREVINAPTLDECRQCEGTGTTQSASNLEDEVCPVCDGTGIL